MGLGFLTLVGVTEKDSTRDANSKFENLILNKLDAHTSRLGSKQIDLIKKSASSPAAFQDLGEATATVAKASQSSSVAVALSSHDNESKLSSASAIASGVVLGLFEDWRYKSESKKPSLSCIDIIGFGTGPELENKLKHAEDVSYGVIFGRELINSPANVLTPAVLADEAAKCSVRTKLVLIGKGLTFDSGGYNIKAGPAIGEIKHPGVEVHFIVAVCENMISGTGMRHGDVITASNEKTIELSKTTTQMLKVV
ncbi:BnaC01g35310D [Brassica napus]|uniref:BnaC01g35310D protein n=1 Tax=Brassica napus TaxID=3708 RepID=A0A078GS62_BRANA|nr:BnaC01g35310D [Brassica napus]